MKNIEFFYRPKGTFFLIATNVLVFLIFQTRTFNDVNLPNFIDCVKKNDPGCIEYVNFDDKEAVQKASKCAMKKAGQNLSSNDCYYDFSDCYKNSEVIASCVSGRGKLFSKYGLASSDISFSRLYTFITSMFIHDGVAHILSNIFFLLIVGALVESRIGIKKFFILYFVSGIVASICSTLFYSGIGQPVIEVGASGAIFGLFGANLVLNYYKNKNEKTARIFKNFYSYGFSVSLLIVFLYIQFISLVFLNGEGVGYATHIGGFLAGFILIFFLKSKDEEYRYY